MYELIAGVHPTWTRKEDKLEYKEKMRSFKKLDFHKYKFSE